MGVMIEGVELTMLREIADERGAVLHMLRSDSPGFTSFGECYFSEVLPGVVKGWKRHTRQTQNISVPVGRMRFVLFDGREHSSSYKSLQVVELGRPDAYMRITIPPGIWYGFSCISNDKSLVVNCADIPHTQGEGETAELGANFIPYDWKTGQQTNS